MTRTAIGIAVTILWTAAAPAQDVSFAIGMESPALDAAFYAGQPDDGSDVAGRMVLYYGPSNDGTKIAFSAINLDTFANALFIVNVGDPASWTRLTGDFPLRTSPIYWAPNNRHVLWDSERIDTLTGNREPNLSVHGYPLRDVSVTRLGAGDWIASLTGTSFNWEIVLIPILANGAGDPFRQPVIVTNFGNMSPTYMTWPSISRDASAVTFSYYTDQDPPDMVADLSDIFLVKDLHQIIAAPKIPSTDISTLAPTSLGSPSVVEIRTTDSDNFAHVMRISEDGNYVFFGEDFNNQFNDENFFPSVAAGNWDIMIKRADGTGMPFRIAEPGNQATVVPFPGGTRFLYVRDFAGVLNLFITTLEVSTTVAGTTVGAPADNTILADSPQTAADASNTLVTIPAGTTITFPMGAPQEIVISTPIDPVTGPQLPPNPAVHAMPVLREFGPAGTTFSPPIEITIAYTDAEIAGLAENSLHPYLFNAMTGVFDTPVPAVDIIARDFNNNTITFRVSHFSTYGLAGTLPQTMPASRGVLPVAITVLVATLALSLVTRRRNTT